MRLCKNDNLGVRHSLMYLYAATENEKKAAKLYKKFEFFDSSLILSLSILYYRKKDLKESLKYLKELEEGNKDTKKFFKFVYEGKIDNILEEINDIEKRYEKIKEENHAFDISMLDITGKDLMELGIPKGPKIGESLEELLKRVIEDPKLNNKELLLDIAKNE